MTGTIGDEEGSAEMVGLVVQLVSLTQDLVEAKLRLEAVENEKMHVRFHYTSLVR